MAEATPVIPAATQAAAPVPGTPEYDAAMVKKVDDVAAATKAATDPATPAAPVRPEGLPEKFKSWEDMAKSYAELEKKLGAPAEPAKPAVVDPAKPAVVDPAKPAVDPLAIKAEDDAATKAVASAGLDMGKLQSEFNEHGKLTPESLAALDKIGIPQAMVDAYIEGRTAVQAQYNATAFATAGSEEAYTKMVTWAKTGMSQAEQNAFNESVASGDKAKMTMAVSALKSRFTTQFGDDPELVNGTVAGGLDAYDSMAQVTADMKKPEYKKDPAFRAKVEAKLKRSTIFTTTTPN